MTNIPNLERLERLERLEHLKTVARNIAPEALNMDVFGRRTPCGTVACLGGHAALDPHFNAQGLTAHWRGVPSPYQIMEIHCREFKPLDAHVSLQLFFGLTERQMTHLFQPRSYSHQLQPPISELVRHIDNVLEGRVI
jgi:hypothetical protein